MPVLAALVPCSVLAQSGTISGTVRGPDLNGVIVIACLLVNHNCDDAQSKAVQAGPDGRFSLEGLGEASYLILAWRDLNGSGVMDAGDEVGIYTQDGRTPALVKPTSQNISLRLRPFDSNAASVFAAATPPSSGSAVGEWSTVGVGPDVVNSATGGFVGANNSAVSLSLDAKGNYKLSEYIYITQLGGCHNWILTTTAGTYHLGDGQLFFTPKTSYEKYQSGCSPATSYTRKDDPKDLKPFMRWWKVEAGSQGEEVFSLSGVNDSDPNKAPDWFYAWHLRRVKQ
jgi:hypothetical protein